MQADHCPERLCDGSGWILEDGNVARPCACRRRRIEQAGARRIGTGIPKRFRGVSFERKPVCDLDPALLREVRRFLRELEDNLREGRGLWFHGDVGTGKTSLAMLISKEAMEAGHSVAIYSVPFLLADIKETFDAASERSYMELFRRLCDVDLLQLDDLGAEKQTEWVLEQLYSIVNERWQNKRSILVTSNLLTKDGAHTGEPSEEDLDWSVQLRRLSERIGARTLSRLGEICEEPKPVMGSDLRASHMVGLKQTTSAPAA